MAQKDLRSKVLEFLYSQVREGKVPQIKKGMVEDLEKFVLDYLADQEMKASAEHMQALKPTGDGVTTNPGYIKVTRAAIEVSINDEPLATGKAGFESAKEYKINNGESNE